MPESPMAQAGEITQLLAALREGRPEAPDRLVPLVYEELRQIARAYLRSERPDHTLQPTELLHETYCRLVGQRDIDWRDRTHFFGVAAHLMRLILVDHGRKHRSEKHGGGRTPVALDKIQIGSWDNFEGVLAIDEALEKLGQIDARLVRVVELRFFAELSLDESAEVLGVSRETVKRDWNIARAWLASALTLEPRREP